VHQLRFAQVEEVGMQPKLRTPALVALSGAVGGLASGALQVLNGLKPFNGSTVFVMFALPFVGALAAMIAVYLIANSDTEKLAHTLGFALVCGIFWQPVIASAKLYVDHVETQHQTSGLRDSNQALANGLKNPTPEVRNEVTRSGDTAASLLEKLPNVQDAELRKEVIQESKAAVDNIQTAASATPDSSIKSLEKIGVAAAQNGQTEVAQHALVKLGEIRAENPQASSAATQASERIVNVAERAPSTLRNATR
jgi:hypothetical protein